MFLRLLAIAMAALLCGPICSTALAQAAEKELTTLAEQLAKSLIKEKHVRVTALDFTDIRGRPNELGVYLAEQFEVEMFATEGIKVLDRRNIARIMAEQQLTADGLIDPENAKKIGRFAGVDATFIGSVVNMDNDIVLTVKAISTETAVIVASGRARLPSTPDFKRMLGLSVAAGGGGVARGAANGSAVPPAVNGASAVEGDAISAQEVGPITAVLRNVVEHSVQIGSRNWGDEQNVAAIRCTFDLENRNLQRSVAVAANQRVRETEANEGLGVEIVGYRGGLADSNKMPWTLKEVNGISAVVCFEGDGKINNWMGVRQGNPGGVVDYIRTAKKYDGGSPLTAGDRARFWSGSFGSIGPGQKIRITVDFVPAMVLERRDRSGRTADSPPRATPDHFQFDMELVLATYAEGEDPLKAKDLALRNLTLDRVILPKAPTTPAP